MVRLLVLASLATTARGQPTAQQVMMETPLMMEMPLMPSPVISGGEPGCAFGDEACAANLYMPQKAAAAGFELSVPADSPELLSVGDCVMATIEIPYESPDGGRVVVPPRSTGLVIEVRPDLLVDWDGSWTSAAARPEHLSRMQPKVGKLVAVKMSDGGGPLVQCLTSSWHVSTPGYGRPVTMENCFNTPSQEFVLPVCGHGLIRPSYAPDDCLSILGSSSAVIASCSSEQGSQLRLNADRMLEAHLPDGTLGCLDLVTEPLHDPLVVVPCELATTQFNFA